MGSKCKLSRGSLRSQGAASECPLGLLSTRMLVVRIKSQARMFPKVRIVFPREKSKESRCSKQRESNALRQPTASFYNRAEAPRPNLEDRSVLGPSRLQR